MADEVSPTHLSGPKTEDDPPGESNCMRKDWKNENNRIECVLPRKSDENN
jgi:hypothetical protein